MNLRTYYPKTYYMQVSATFHIKKKCVREMLTKIKPNCQKYSVVLIVEVLTGEILK